MRNQLKKQNLDNKSQRPFKFKGRLKDKYGEDFGPDIQGYYEFEFTPDWEDYYDYYLECVKEPANLGSKETETFYKGVKAAIKAIWEEDGFDEKNFEQNESFIEHMKERYREKAQETSGEEVLL